MFRTFTVQKMEWSNIPSVVSCLNYLASRLVTLRRFRRCGNHIVSQSHPNAGRAVECGGGGTVAPYPLIAPLIL